MKKENRPAIAFMLLGGAFPILNVTFSPCLRIIIKTTMVQTTLEQRKIDVRKGYALELAIEGKFTNLRIWIGASKCKAEGGVVDTVYIRLDRANHYSAPLSDKSFAYLETDCKAVDSVKELLEFGFTSPLEKLDEILEITKGLKDRQCIAW
jgi:hypothetical protein